MPNSVLSSTTATLLLPTQQKKEGLGEEGAHQCARVCVPFPTGCLISTLRPACLPHLAPCRLAVPHCDAFAACSLGVLVRKVGEARVLELVRGLCDKLVAAPAKKEAASRDIATIGLKTVIEAAGGSLAGPAAALINARMLEGVQQKVLLLQLLLLLRD